MGRREEMVALAEKLMQSKDNIRNIGTVAHIDHGKTTLSDSLIAAAGLISHEAAGNAQVMDYEDQEQERGITINAANISLVFNFEGTQTLVNLIDTPGHVDFTGEVIRAMRAVDGVIVVVDAVEGIMPQTETVIRQALREYVQPVLFINKVDRLIKELQVTEEDMQKRFAKIITAVNTLIVKNAPDQFKKDWQVDAVKGTVAFGSAKRKWAVSVPYMQKSNIKFKQVYDHLKNDQEGELAKISPVHEVTLQMVKNFLPSPKKAQAYRIRRIWAGDQELPIYKSMTTCDEKGDIAMMITDVSVDQHAGDIATGRIYSGTVEPGMTVKLVGMQKDARVQKVGLFMGNEFINVSHAGPGNIAALVGIKDVYAGETVSTAADMKEFESFMSSVEPVITVSVEAKKTQDLPKLITAIRQLTKEDPNLRASINQETGEHLLSGMGELHLDVNRYRIENNYKVPVQMGNPIVVYKETMTKKSPTLEGKTPNRHNRFLMHVEPLSKDFLEKLIDTKIDGKIRDKDRAIVDKLIEIGLDRDEAKKTWAVHNNSLLVDATRGISSLFEIKELVIQGFNDALDAGPLAKEKVFGLKVVLEDATLHEDSIHRGPAQMLPAMVRTIYAGVLAGNPVLYEPKQLLTITVPQDQMGSTTKELSARRTQIQEMRTEGDATVIISKAPVKELIGFAAAIRGATQGRAIWTAEYAGYEQLPTELQKPTITEIRKRKGMDPEVKAFTFFLD
ncbi:MAG: elongation factor EF-2 [Candidatus Diapherotrites archaeon]|uniref:Elongation factor 2 n=1 Tax=Candidatus Iainarchaeum sp. TaxID=3101447 RepID=A0A8T4L401_9ARCH|nr:elongation factor EF-2 [Candidatus Diapherotrites archaeon]